MKKITILLIATLYAFGAMAQDRAAGIKNYDYQKYQTAIDVLTPLAAEDDYANYYLGLSYIGLEEIAKAKATFQKYNDDAANMAGLARIMFIEKKDAEAKAMLENVIRKASRKDKRAYLYAADAVTYTDGGDLAKAIEWYDYFLEWKKVPDVLIRKGDAYRKMNDGGGKAMTSYQSAAEQGGDVSLSSYKQGNLWYASRTYDSALTLYQRSIDADAKNPLPYYDLSYIYYYINKYELAKENIEQYLALSDKSTEDQMQYANILYLSKNYDDAITKLEELMKQGVVKSYMYRVLGYSYLEKNNQTEALKNMDLLFKNHPKDKLISQDYFTYGKILTKEPTRMGEAATYFERGIATDTAKDKTALYRQLAESFKDADDYASAAKWYDKIVMSESDTKDILDYWWAGYSYYRLSDYTKANAMFTKMTEERPEEPSGHYWLGKVAAAQDPDFKTGKATDLFKKFIPMVEGNQDQVDNIVTAYVYLSVVSYNQKKYAEAKKYADKIIALKPDNGTAKQILAGIPK